MGRFAFCFNQGGTAARMKNKDFMEKVVENDPISMKMVSDNDYAFRNP